MPRFIWLISYIQIWVSVDITPVLRSACIPPSLLERTLFLLLRLTIQSTDSWDHVWRKLSTVCVRPHVTWPCPALPCVKLFPLFWRKVLVDGILFNIRTWLWYIPQLGILWTWWSWGTVFDSFGVHLFNWPVTAFILCGSLTNETFFIEVVHWQVLYHFSGAICVCLGWNKLKGRYHNYIRYHFDLLPQETKLTKE